MNPLPKKPRKSHSLTKKVQGQPSWRLASKDVEAFVTEQGGHLGPVIYDRRGSKLSPFEVAPWATEPLDRSLPPVLQVMRGDFFCMPFGGNEAPYRKEQHLPHGETANADWKFESMVKTGIRNTLHLSLHTKVRTGRVDKYISTVDGHHAIYSRHVISGMSGPMNMGHHAILKFPDKAGSGRISTSSFRFGQVYVKPTELPENRGYSALLPGAKFDSLDKVPTIFGKDTDLSRYPARRGYEDIVILASDPDLPFAWTAVSFPEQQYVWFALKDPKVLRQTLFWMSNGGRHYSPWSGRHINAMGLEEVTSYFHEGLAESVRENPIAAAGYPTSILLDPKNPLTVNYIMAAAKSPKGFDRVANIEVDAKNGGVKLTSDSGKQILSAIDIAFLSEK